MVGHQSHREPIQLLERTGGRRILPLVHFRHRLSRHGGVLRVTMEPMAVGLHLQVPVRRQRLDPINPSLRIKPLQLSPRAKAEVRRRARVGPGRPRRRLRMGRLMKREARQKARRSHVVRQLRQTLQSLQREANLTPIARLARENLMTPPSLELPASCPIPRREMVATAAVRPAQEATLPPRRARPHPKVPCARTTTAKYTRTQTELLTR